MRPETAAAIITKGVITCLSGGVCAAPATVCQALNVSFMVEAPEAFLSSRNPSTLRPDVS